jgi:flagellin
MGLTINTNTTSMASQRHLANNSSNLGSSFEKLSSGLRINSAQDDAAGMNIATKLTAQVKGLN